MPPQAPSTERDEMIAALRGAYRAMDFLFAKCIEHIPNFRPTESGVWPEMVAVFEVLQKVNAP